MVPGSWVVLALCAALPSAAEESRPEGLVAHWTFAEGAGAVLHDVSGQGHDGALHRVDWATSPSGPGLAFGRSDSYVDCGDRAELKIAGDLTIEAWVRLDPATYPDNTTNWSIVNWEDYPRSGFLLRIEGWRSVLLFRCSNGEQERYVQSERTLDPKVFYHVAVVKRGSVATLYIDGLADGCGEVRHPGPSRAPFLICARDQSFDGLIDDLRVYNRALPAATIISDFRAGAERHQKDTSAFGRLVLKPYFYFAEGRVLVDVDCRGLLPLAEGETVAAELGLAGGAAFAAHTLDALAQDGRGSAEFPLAGLAAGEYEVRALVRRQDGSVRAQAAQAFRYPPSVVSVPAPEQQMVAPLPPPAGRLPYEVGLCRGGGFLLSIRGKDYPVESSFSFPHAGDNRLVASAEVCRSGEAAWTVKTSRLRREVTAAGGYYRLHRQLTALPNRIVVRDTVTNRTQAPLGVIVVHEVALGGALAKSYVMGFGSTASVPERGILYNPTILMQKNDFGLGLVALDDVLIVQSLGAVDKAAGRATLGTRSFALDAGGSYTFEWALYPVASGDYYDFINEIRRDEGRNAVTVDSNWACLGDPRRIPDAEYMRLRNARYLEHGSPYAPPEDPELSYQSFDLLQFPREMARLKQHNAALLDAFPDAKPNIHVGPWLYLTDRPAEAFPDSRIIAPDGSQGKWPLTNFVYLSKARQAAGWQWYGFYPTLTNSYGRALLASVDPFIDELGFRGLFLDGFFWGMAGWTTESEWDGHSAEIDPVSRTITRRYGSVLLLAQEALVAYARKVKAKGADLIANNMIVTRTMGRLPVIVDKEITEGPTIHLAQTPVALGNPDVIRSEQGLYADVRNKLKWGNLYFWYGGDSYLRHPTVPTRMYPFTVEEIHADYVKGRERLVTAIPGAYGWPGSHELHYAWLYDGRGREHPNTLLSTADGAGVRTQVVLEENGMAVVERIPVSVEASDPVNVVTERYDATGVCLALHGSGRIRLTLRDGRFAIPPGVGYTVRLPAGTRQLRSSTDGVLAFAVRLEGPASVEVQQAGGDRLASPQTPTPDKE
jgi:hypothetical protein